VQIEKPQTIVIVAADTITPEADVLMRYLNGMSGEFRWYRVGSNRPLPQLTGAHVIVYWDMLTETVSRKADTATRVSSGECGDAVNALRGWWQLKPGRSAVLDGRAMSMFSGGTLTRGGTRELSNMWQYVAGNAAGGLLVLGGNGSQQACLGRVLGGLGFGSVRGSEPNSTFGMPGDSRSPLWMCPQPALHRSQRYWSTFGFPARYAVSASSIGGVVPYGVQPNKVYLRGVAYYGGGEWAGGVGTGIRMLPDYVSWLLAVDSAASLRRRGSMCVCCWRPLCALVALPTPCPHAPTHRPPRALQTSPNPPSPSRWLTPRRPSPSCCCRRR
jgi:hypothetical protein